MPVQIDSIQFGALVDSGATHSIIGPGLIKKLPKLVTYLQPVDSKVIAKTVNGGFITYAQELTFPLLIQGQTWEIRAYYSPILNYDLIIGYDFLKKAKLTVNFGNLDIQPPREYVIKAPEDLQLAPQGELIAWGKLTGDPSLAEGILQTHGTLQKLGFLVARGLVKIDPSNPLVPVRLLNPYPYTRIIKKGTKLATIERLTKAYQITEISPTETINQVGQQSKVKFSPPKEFSDLFSLTESTFDENQKKELLSLLWEYSDIFLKKGDKLKCTDVLEFKIKLKEGTQPFKAKPYRSNPKLCKEITKEIQKLLEDGIIRHSTSNFTSPILLVLKPDGSYRPVIDYRLLNSKCIKDNMPMISSQDCLESIGSAQAKYFSTVDLQSGYYQVPIEESSKPLTAFISHDGIFEFNRMSFGLANAPACFTRLMTRVLQGLNWDIALLYLDDVVVFSRDFQGHLVNLRLVFDRLRAAKLTLKPSKCMFDREMLKFLGHIISARGIEVMEDKCKAVREFPQPRKIRDVRAFLGLASYYRKFIKDFSKIAAPLIDLTKKETTFQWTDKCKSAFQTLKQKLVEAPILAYPDYQQEYLLYKERVISYGGKKLGTAEQKYSTTERECLGVIIALKHFEHYLRGVPVTINTDHAALKWLLAQKEPKGRIARWVAFLQQFNYTVKHQPGKSIGHADGLSRMDYYEGGDIEGNLDEQLDSVIFPNDSSEKTNLAKVIFKGRRTRPKGQKPKLDSAPVLHLPIVEWTKERLRECQLSDLNIRPIIIIDIQKLT